MAQANITLRLVAQDLATGKISGAIGKLDQLSRQGGLTARAVQGIGMSFGMMLNPAFLAAGAIGSVTNVLGDAVDAARDQEEALNKVREVFDEAAYSVEDFADTAARSLGLSEEAALSAAGWFGNLFVEIGESKSRAAQFSKELVALSADLASFNNLDPNEALQKLQGGLVGQTRALRELGIVFEDSQIIQRLRDQGLEVTQQNKVLARYQLILEQSSIAQGDFGRTSDRLANQQRIMAAEMDDALSDLGESLMPIQLAITEMARDTLPKFTDALQDVQDAMAPIVDLLGDIPPELRDLFGKVFLHNLGVVPGALEAVNDELQILDTNARASAGSLNSMTSYSKALKSGLADLGETTEQITADGINPLEGLFKVPSPTEMLTDLRKSLKEANAEIGEILASGEITDKRGRNLLDRVQWQFQKLWNRLPKALDLETPAGDMAALYIASLSSEIIEKEGKLEGAAEQLGIDIQDDLLTGVTLDAAQVRSFLPADQTLNATMQPAGAAMAHGLDAGMDANKPTPELDLSVARSQISELEAEWATAFGSSPTVTVRKVWTGTPSSTSVKLHSGGRLQQGQDAIIRQGEAYLAAGPGGGNVVPLDRAGGPTVNVYGDVYGIDDLASKVGPAITRWQRSQGVA